MSRMASAHKSTTDGIGKCSVPMWRCGLPGGFCNRDAYGERPPGDTWRDAYTGEERRWDGKYNGYVPGLACPIHGGPETRAHQGDPCGGCGVARDDVPIGPCPGAMES